MIGSLISWPSERDREVIKFIKVVVYGLVISWKNHHCEPTARSEEIHSGVQLMAAFFFN